MRRPNVMFSISRISASPLWLIPSWRDRWTSTCHCDRLKPSARARWSNRLALRVNLMRMNTAVARSGTIRVRGLPFPSALARPVFGERLTFLTRSTARVPLIRLKKSLPMRLSSPACVHIFGVRRRRLPPPEMKRGAASVGNASHVP